MAISFVGSASAAAVSGGDPSIDLTTITDLAEGDLVIVAYAIGHDNNTGRDLVINSPTDYQEVADLISGDTQDVELGVFYKVQGETPDTAVVCEGFGGMDDAVAAVAMVFRGVDTTTPMDVAATTATGIDTMHPVPPAINHNNPAGVWIVIAGASGHVLGGSGSYTFPTGYTTNPISRGSDDSDDVTVGLGYRSSLVSDPETPGTMTHSGVDSNVCAWCAVTMALRPAIVVVNATANPTTVAATGATGTAAIQAGAQFAVTGVSAAAAIGNLSAEAGGAPVSVDVAGVQSASAVGTLTATGGASAAVAGVSSSVTAGDLTVSGSAATALTGASVAGAVGDVSVAAGSSAELSGVSATSAVGAVTVDAAGNASAELSGTSANAMAGDVSVTATAQVSVSGVAATSSAGDLDVTAGASVSVPGVDANAQVGTLTAEVEGETTAQTSGAAATGAAGTVTVGTDAIVSVSGAASTTQVGSLSATGGADILVDITGVVVTGAVGDTSLEAGASVTPDGVEALGQAGDIRDAVIVPSPGIVSAMSRSRGLSASNARRILSATATSRTSSVNTVGNVSGSDSS